MSLDYNILWIEDTDASFGTYSRRTRSYIEDKNFRCDIKWLKNKGEFNQSDIDVKNYDLIIVDYVLGTDTYGHEIIKEIRDGNHLNDVLFYSAASEGDLLGLLHGHGIDGVYIAEKLQDTLIEKIRGLVDKAIMRTINPVNIRGLVMDVTSEFDSTIKHSLIMAWNLLDDTMKSSLINYAKTELIESRKSAICKLEDVISAHSFSISDLLENREFTSSMMARLLNKVLALDCANLLSAKGKCINHLSSVKFYSEYDKEVIEIRNKLAHLKLDTSVSGPVHIGKINGVDYICDEDFCNMVRKNLLKYQDFFRDFYAELESK